MPNFESSELGLPAADALSATRIQMLARRLEAAGAEAPDQEALKKVAQDFASVFYSLTFKELQKSVRMATEEDGNEDDEDGGDGPVLQGVEDFVSMFLPQTLAASKGDALTTYIYESLKDFYGGRLDESA